MFFNGNGQPINNYRKKELVKIGQHEVAHYIVAKLLGFNVGAISLKVTHIHEGHDGTAEITLYRGLKSLQETQEYLKKRIIVLYAGVLGESLSSGKINDEYAVEELNKGGKSDFDKCRELLQILNNITHTEAIDEEEADRNLKKINDDLWGKAVEMVEQEHEIIVELGMRIAYSVEYVGHKFELSNDEINNLPAIQKRFYEKR
jgi:hypothetical protein